MRLPLADRFNHGWLAAWLALALLWIAQASTSLLEPMERRWADHALASSSAPAHSDIVLVTFDDESLAAIGPWPWSREAHAKLIDRLTQAQARLVVHTTPFVRAESPEALAQLKRIATTVAADPQLAEHPGLTGLVQQSQDLLDGDGSLALSLAQNGRTLLTVAENGGGRIEWPLAQLSSAALGVGRLHWQTGNDGQVRTLALRSRADGRELPSLPLWIAASSLGRHPAELAWQDPGLAALGSLRWPVDSLGNVQPRWQRMDSQQPRFERFRADLVLAGQIPPAKLAGRIVLIGATSPAMETPTAVAGAGLLTNVEMLAEATAALLTGELVERPRWAGNLQVVCLALIGLFLAIAAPRLTLASSASIALLASAALLSGSYLALSRWSLAIPVMPALCAAWLGLATFGLVQRRKGTSLAPTRTDSHLGGAPGASFASVALQPTAADQAPSPAKEAAPAAVRLSSFSEVGPGSATAPTVPAHLDGAADAATKPRRRLPELGGFQLLREVGRGAMGRVYMAEQVSTGRQVAIKTLALTREFEGFALQEARTRFQREALAALRLRHPDIVRVHDAGEDQGYAWIAMELLKGHDLLRHTRTSALLPVPEVLEICARVAGALAHAHAQGVIHRDIKPANVMFDAPSGMVKVTDFGIARITDAARTRTGLVLGSPSYMSPEQLAGQAVDGRSDLYSLGVVLFQLLTGSLPAEGDSMAKLMHAVAYVPAPDVRSLRPRLPEPVANVVALALEKRVELRYANANAMHSDLNSVLSLWSVPAADPIERSATRGSVQEVSRDHMPEAPSLLANNVLMQNQPR